MDPSSPSTGADAGAKPARRFSAHIGYLFAELPLEQRFAAARSAGFAAVEHPNPYSMPANLVAHRLADSGLPFVQMAMPAGDAAKGEKGIAILPDRRAEFADSIERGLDYAEAIGCTMVHAMAGVEPQGIAREVLWSTYIENLGRAADAARARRTTLIIEPIGSGTIAGYFIHSPALAAQAIDNLGRDNVRLLLDVFHCANAGLDPGTLIRRHADIIAHIHIADHPGRHEPGTGALDFHAVYGALSEIGYGGFLGCEYIPAGTTEDGLAWLTSDLGRQPEDDKELGRTAFPEI